MHASGLRDHSWIHTGDTAGLFVVVVLLGEGLLAVMTNSSMANRKD